MLTICCFQAAVHSPDVKRYTNGGFSVHLQGRDASWPAGQLHLLLPRLQLPLASQAVSVAVVVVLSSVVLLWLMLLLCGCGACCCHTCVTCADSSPEWSWLGPR